MKKLNLELEELVVASFDTTPRVARSRGTVRGHMPRGTSVLEGTIEITCEITCHACVPGETYDSCNGPTCFGVSCGPAGSCSNGCETQTAC